MSDILKQLLFRREAEKLAGMTRHAFQYHLDCGHITPCKEEGTGRGKTQLFWKEDVENLKRGKYKEVQKMEEFMNELKELKGEKVSLLELDNCLHPYSSSESIFEYGREYWKDWKGYDDDATESTFTYTVDGKDMNVEFEIIQDHGISEKTMIKVTGWEEL